MPIYEYQCDACGKRSEVIQKISDPPLEDCPKCGEKKVRKLVSAAAFRLKGGGWYETDFKDSKRKNLAGDGGGDKAGEKSEAKSDEKKSEPAKSETKSEPPAAAAAGE